MKGCLLPYLLFVRSDQIPIIGSDIASMIKAKKNAVDTVHASKPKTSDEKPLTESQIKAIEQLKDLYDKKLISKDVYDIEIAAIKK